MAKKDLQQVEFGDFQTPDVLARLVARIVALRGVCPQTIVEPTCGRGAFLIAAIEQFATSRAAIGLEINPGYFKDAQSRVLGLARRPDVDVRQADFFTYDWQNVFAAARKPILVIGNPPWVTASELGILESRNLPTKSNFQNRTGVEAITGKSNFDIAEWMWIHILQWLREYPSTVAMLVKTSVARRVLSHAWQENLPLDIADLYEFDAKKYFGVGVSACLLVCDIKPGLGKLEKQCRVRDMDKPERVDHTVAFHRGMVLADVDAFERHEGLLQGHGARTPYRWRSGVKHDCSKVMEFGKVEGGFQNGFGEVVSLEPDYLFPMMKGSEVANGRTRFLSKFMLVTQKDTGQPTETIRHVAPRTWAYLRRHAGYLDKRGSSIYRNRPQFSIFGVGPYTFAPWKVAVCGLYKRLDFFAIGPREGKPVVVDDTVYFLSCKSAEEAELLLKLLHSAPAQEFLNSFIFWDSKRPITAEALGRLDLVSLAEELGEGPKLAALLGSEARVGLAGAPTSLLF